MEGLTGEDRWNHRLGYGEMWHICEKHLATKKPSTFDGIWNGLKGYVEDNMQRYPMQADQVRHWYNVCKVQFPLYVAHWCKQRDVLERAPLLQEQEFNIPYKLPSGRIVKLRGKWDSVDIIGKGKGAGIYLQENKTKGDIDENRMMRQLSFDLQTMMYMVALSEYKGQPIYKAPINGVRYNVVRRPLSGGRGTIKKHEPSKKNPAGETDASFYARLAEIIGADPAYFFMRWKAEITKEDVARFRRECLDPLLEQLCEWWDHMMVLSNSSPFTSPTSGTAMHWRHPYGVFNALDEGYSTELDTYLETGNRVGLHRIKTVFPEMES
jgi:hypothetical protein